MQNNAEEEDYCEAVFTLPFLFGIACIGAENIFYTISRQIKCSFPGEAPTVLKSYRTGYHLSLIPWCLSIKAKSFLDSFTKATQVNVTTLFSKSF